MLTCARCFLDVIDRVQMIGEEPTCKAKAFAKIIQLAASGEKPPVFAVVVTVGFGSVPTLSLKVGISNWEGGRIGGS